MVIKMINSIYIALEAHKISRLAEKDYPDEYNKLLNDRMDLRYIYSYWHKMQVDAKYKKFYTDNYPELSLYLRLLSYGYFFPFIYFAFVVIEIIITICHTTD